MNSVTFRSFRKLAAANLAGEDSPPDYATTRASVVNQFPKLAVSLDWMREKIESGAANASPERLKGFADRQGAASKKILGGLGGNDLADARRTREMAKGNYLSPMRNAVKRSYASTTARALGKFAASSRVGQIAELAGLGTLGLPAAHHLMSGGKKEWSEKNKARAEVVGLGTLAAPYAHGLASRRPGYRRFAGAVAKRIPQALKNG
jgi:hypothetical protein